MKLIKIWFKRQNIFRSGWLFNQPVLGDGPGILCHFPMRISVLHYCRVSEVLTITIEINRNFAIDFSADSLVIKLRIISFWFDCCSIHPFLIHTQHGYLHISDNCQHHCLSPDNSNINSAVIQPLETPCLKWFYQYGSNMQIPVKPFPPRANEFLWRCFMICMKITSVTAPEQLPDLDRNATFHICRAKGTQEFSNRISHTLIF